jgi:predicted MFS family arabinose efflux permease
MLSSALLAVLSWQGVLSLEAIFAIAVLRGAIQGMDMPARQSFVLEMVDRESLASAVAMNSAIFNTGRVAGPARAGLLLAHAGATICFTVDAASFLALLAALAMMHIPRRARPARPPRAYPLHELWMGRQYGFHKPAVRRRLAMLFVAGACRFSYGTRLPLFADHVFGGGKSTFGYLTSAVGVGAVVGALSVSAFCRNTRQGRWIVGGVLLGAAALGVLAVTWTIWIGLACMVVLGFAQLMHNSPSNSGVQMAGADRYRGRLTSLWSMTFIGSMPLGALFASTLARFFGPHWAVGTGAILSLAAALAIGTHLLRLDKT